ncbi:MAG: hypothetical protein RIQ89_1693 [Bacteroidota bacterium]|jgi:outer membrane cobalamin receptor
MRILFLLGLLLSSLWSQAQEGSATKPPTENQGFYDLSLEELMNIPVTVASSTALSNRESPGIITTITASEIAAIGANDLIDVLKTIPGFNFGVDVCGVVGLMIRGNWAQEGKVLMIIDGLRINEEAYGTLQFGNHFSVDQIEKIEIIRGPGSAMYGGYASLAVINITTKQFSQTSGTAAALNLGATARGTVHQSLSLDHRLISKKTTVAVSAFAAKAIRSDRSYADLAGNEYDMLRQSDLNNLNFKTMIAHGNTTAQFLVDRYLTTQRDAYGSNLSQAYRTDFNSLFAELKHKIELSSNHSLTALYQFKQSTPFLYDQESIDEEYARYYVNVNRHRIDLSSNAQLTNKIKLLSGIELYSDQANSKRIESNFNNGSNKLEINNAIFYSEGMYRSTTNFNITAGFRYHYSTGFKAVFTPRIALTKVFDKLHLKALLSQAYRNPSIENINVGINIAPEHAGFLELEAGYKFNDKWNLTANTYYIEKYGTILYYFDTQDRYINHIGTAASLGAEAELKFKSKKWYININTAIAHAVNQEAIQTYSTGIAGRLIGAAYAKYNLQINHQLNSTFSININHSLTGKRFASSGFDADGNNLMATIEPQLFSDLAITISNLFNTRMKVVVGCYNLLNEQELFIQPYNNEHNPLPGLSRNFRIKLAYNF